MGLGSQAAGVENVGGERTEGRTGRGSLNVGGRRAMQGWKKR